MSEARILEIEDDEVAGASPAHEEEPRQEISYEDMQKLVRSAEEKAARERIRAERAEQEAARNRDSAVSEAEARYNAEVQGIEAGISGADAEVKALKAESARQLENADWNGGADTQIGLAQSAARLTNLRATKEYLSANKDILLAQAKKPQPAQPQATQGGYTARELAWIAEHP